MFCKNCNNQIADDSQFCPECGADLSEAVEEQKTNEAEAPAEETVETAPVQEAAEKSGKFDFNQIVPKVRESLKKHTKFWIGGVAVVLALLIVVNLSGITGFFVKLFGSEESYVQYVEDKTVESVVDAGTSVYGTLLDVVDMNYGAEVEVDIELSKDAIKSLEDATDMDLEWLSNLGMFMSTNVKKDAASANVGVTIGNNDLINVEAIIDVAGKQAFVGLLNLSDKYLTTGEIELPENFSLDIVADLAKALPSEAKVNKLLDKYLKLALDQIDDVSEDKETIKAGDIEQKVTASTVKIKQKTVLDMGIAVLEEAKEDKEIKGIIVDLIKAAQKQEMLKDYVGEIDADEAYESLVAMLDTTLEGLKAQKDAIQDNTTVCVIVDYIDGNHKIVGREIKVPAGEENKTVFSYVIPHKGSKFAFKAEASGLKITGEGKDNNGVITGEFKVSAAEEGMALSICTIGLEKFDTDALTKGEIKGTVTISPNKAIGSALGSFGSSAIGSIASILEFDLQLVFDAGLDNGTIEINALEKDEFYAGITLKYKSGKGDGVKIPSDKKTCTIEEMDEYLESLDFDKIVKALKKGKVDSDIIDMVEQALEGIEEGGFDISGLLGSSVPDFGFGGSSVPSFDFGGSEYEDSYNDEVYVEENVWG